MLIINQVISPSNLVYFSTKLIYKEENLYNTTVYAFCWWLEDQQSDYDGAIDAIVAFLGEQKDAIQDNIDSINDENDSIACS